MSGARERSAASPQRLDRERILVAAVALIDESGLHELSMRSVGRRLGVEAMALYRYLPSRDSLLDGVVELVVDELYADPEVHLAPQDDWQDFVVRLAHGVRRTALRHPQVFPLIATRPPQAPWVRPPLRSLRWIESLLEGLLGRGFTEQQAVTAYQAFSSFLVGHLLLEVSALGVDVGPVEQDEAAAVEPTEPVALASYPVLLRLAPLLAADHFAAEFDASLADLVRRIDPAGAGQAEAGRVGRAGAGATWSEFPL